MESKRSGCFYFQSRLGQFGGQISKGTRPSGLILKTSFGFVNTIPHPSLSYEHMIQKKTVEHQLGMTLTRASEIPGGTPSTSFTWRSVTAGSSITTLDLVTYIPYFKTILGRPAHHPNYWNFGPQNWQPTHIPQPQEALLPITCRTGVMVPIPTPPQTGLNWTEPGAHAGSYRQIHFQLWDRAFSG